MKLFLVGINTIVIASFYLTLLMAGNLKNGVVLNTSLPQKAWADHRVLALGKEYKKKLTLMTVGFLVPGIAIVLINLMSVYLILFFFLLGIYVAVAVRIIKDGAIKLRALKKQEDWFVGNKRTISLDLALSREKSKMPLSRWFFLPAFFISVILIILALAQREFPVYAIASLALNLICLDIWRLYARSKAKTYSQNSDINLSMNRIYMRLWSGSFILLANAGSFIILLAALFSKSSPLLTLLFILLYASGTTGFLFYTSGKIRREQQEILKLDESVIITDDDEYWNSPLGFYNNPDDARLMVEKRFGIGQTINIGNRKGKVAARLTLGFVIVLLAFLSFVFLSLDLIHFEMRIDGEQVNISAPMYSYRFEKEEIRSVRLVNEFPGAGLRTNGAETATYAIGHFSLNDYGKSRLFIYKGYPPYLIIELDGLYVFYNSRVEGEVQELFEILRN